MLNPPPKALKIGAFCLKHILNSIRVIHPRVVALPRDASQRMSNVTGLNIYRALSALRFVVLALCSSTFRLFSIQLGAG